MSSDGKKCEVNRNFAKKFENEIKISEFTSYLTTTKK
jgi:hypothetical protein